MHYPWPWVRLSGQFSLNRGRTTLPTRDDHLELSTRYRRHATKKIITRPLQCLTPTQLHPLRFQPPGGYNRARGPLLRWGVFLWLQPRHTPPDGETNAEVKQINYQSRHYYRLTVALLVSERSSQDSVLNWLGRNYHITDSRALNRGREVYIQYFQTFTSQ